MHYLRIFTVLCTCFFLKYNHVIAQNNKPFMVSGGALPTRWSDSIDINLPFPKYPRPQMIRESWVNLNGVWDYKIATGTSIIPETFSGKILVPFPLESALSNVKKQLLPSEVLWYHRKFVVPQLTPDKKLLLHFGAVDWDATVYINGKILGRHRGGYQSFSLDITSVVKPGDNDLVVKVIDPTDQGIGPHGKQVLNPGNIYYTPSSGIWQTVWMEIVPAIHVEDLVLTPDIDRRVLNLKVNTSDDAIVEVVATDNGIEVGSVEGRAGAPIELPIKNVKMWSPGDPFLYDLTVKLIKNGKKIDEVKSYFGMRKVSIQKDEKGVERIFLNNKPYFNLGTLDQGFWPDGLYTAPTDEALKFDIMAIKSMGFNTIRKHIKVEPARWYYYTDKLGMLVWQDFVNPNQRLPEGSKEQYERELRETLQQLYSYPSIITWTVFNEGWGAFDQQRITELVKSLDHSRLVNGHSGELLYVDNKLRDTSSSPYVSSDMIDIHSYPYPRPVPLVAGKAGVLGEYGGISVPIRNHVWDDLTIGWGYNGLKTLKDLRMEYKMVTDSLIALKNGGLSGAIYTQPFDVESEQNGLITYDREISKVPVEFLYEMNSKLLDESSQNSSELTVTFSDFRSDTIGYGTIVRMFERGRLDSAFLRSLALMAIGEMDTVLAKKVVEKYMSTLNDPFNDHNVRFFKRFTFSTNDIGFRFFHANEKKINSIYGNNFAEGVILNAIYKSEIEPFTAGPKVDWDGIERRVKKYGALGAERLVTARLVYYFDKREWSQFGKYYKLHFETTLPVNRNNLHINNFTWMVFENVSDTAILNFAIKVMKMNIEKYDIGDPYALDTYANLLYKVGRHEEALAFERKAVEISGNRDEFTEVLKKMESKQKTWK